MIRVSFLFHLSLAIPYQINRLPPILRLHLSPFIGLEEVWIWQRGNKRIPASTFHFLFSTLCSLFSIPNELQICPIQKRIVHSIHRLRGAFDFAAEAAFEAIDSPQSIVS